MFFKKNSDYYNTLESSGNLYNGVFIPKEFENIILKHVILNCMNLENFRPAPLLLIQGKKGEGKTFMTETVLKENNIYYKIISSSILAGKNENDAVNNLMLYYNRCQMDPQHGKYSALVIDDFHLSIAITKNNANHTTNADNLLSALMNIADKKSELKTPIILIGNDFSEAYAPLTRFGRANICTWCPSISDKIEIIKRLIIQHKHDTKCVDPEWIKEFIGHCENQYIGFYEQVIENAIFQDFREITKYFSSRHGNVNCRDLRIYTQRIVDNSCITSERMYIEADKLLKKKLLKLDD